MQLQFTLWRSRVARTVFLLFLACTFLPLIVQALLTGHWVEQQLIEGAEERLDGKSRAAQMSIVEDLRHLERSLELFTAGVAARGAFPRELGEQVAEDFLGFALESRSAAQFETLGDCSSGLKLTEDERRFVDSGLTLLAQRDGPDGNPDLFLVRKFQDTGDTARILFARLRQERLWANERLDAGDSEILISDSVGRPLFTTLPEEDLGEDLRDLLARPGHGTRVHLEVRGREFLGSRRTVFMAPQFHANWQVLYSRAEADILAPAVRFRRAFQLVLMLTFCLVLFASLRQIHRVLHPIEELHQGTLRLADQNFSEAVEVNTRDEFQGLADSFNSMSRNINRHMRLARDLHAIGMELSRENDSGRVIELVLRSAQRMLEADSGCVALVGESGRLDLVRVHLDVESTLPDLVCTDGGRMQTLSLDPPRSVSAHAIARQETVHLADWRVERSLGVSEEEDFEHAFGVLREAIIAVPLRDHQDQIIGVLQVGRKSKNFTECAFDDEERRLLEALASQGALALSKNNLIVGFRQMVMSMTEVFAMAVDEKSPYTGAHCRRVPELTMMLAESARRSNTGSLAEFQPTKEELFELEVAALLHDCGKVVTPVHVMDKATKLETIHDRIDLVELRFQLLERDAYIASLEERVRSGGVGDEALRAEHELSEHLADIVGDREFLRRSNIGVERMSAEDCRRVHSIAARYSLQTPRGECVPVLSENEVENLTVAHGTLTAAEREIINDHIAVTVRMLNALHYPEELSRVALLAGSHHERMDGGGYPFGLTREEIPIGGRIMGIADVFEALTDGDRPYKKGKSLQEALELLGGMATSGHLDPELFQLFMDDQIYLRFSERYLSGEYLDPVDLERIPGYAPPPRQPDLGDANERRPA